MAVELPPAVVPSDHSAHNSIGHPGHRLSLRGRLVLLVLAVMVPLLVFLVGFQYHEYREDIADGGERNLALAHSMALLIDEELQERVIALRTLAISRRLAAND